jgi:hypothetical protein
MPALCLLLALIAYSTSAQEVGIWWWTWADSNLVKPPATTSLGFAFNGWAAVPQAIAESAPVFAKLPGMKILSLGGGNGAGAWNKDNVRAVNTSSHLISAAGYTGISYDIEEGESGLANEFLASFAALKKKRFQNLRDR